MSKVRVHNFVVTLDGYSTGEGQSLEAPFGHAQDRFNPWFGATHTWRQELGGAPGSGGFEEAVASTWEQGIGAEIMGRNKFGPQRGPWENHDWRGWWGENPVYHTPCFILTHYPRPSITLEGGTTFHFLDAITGRSPGRGPRGGRRSRCSDRRRAVDAARVPGGRPG